MFEVVKRESIVPNLHLLIVRAPEIAEQVQPGQFVIVRSHDDAERIPLSVADWHREEGTVSIIFMEVGEATSRLARLTAGDTVPTVVGPLGKATPIENYGTVVCVGGCYGIGSLFPIVKALHEKGNRVIVVLEARSRYLLYWGDKIRPHCSRLMAVTRDGTAGYKGHVKRLVDVLWENKIKPDHIIVNGCTYLLSTTSRELAHFDVPVIVSLNPIMIDGTGMCGVCRVTVDGKMKFACVDGPDFDGRLVDWEELLKRRKQYMHEEAYLVHHPGCGRVYR